MHFFCPSCWDEVNEKETICPNCNASIEELESESFVNKLLRALKHPEPQTVLRAIYILGEKQLPETLPCLKEMLQDSDDPYVQSALIRALCKFRDPEIKELIKPFTGQDY